MNQLAAGSLLDGATVPPYSTTTTSSAEFAVGHNHTESGNSFAAAGGLLSVLTQATGTDGWAIDDWQNATVTVEFEIDAVVPSDYSWTQIDIRFQSTYFGFTLIGDSDQATLTLLDGTGVPTSSTGFFGAGGIGGDVETFTVPAAAQFNVAYNSYMLTQFAGSGMEPIQASVEQQFIDWHVSFTLH